MYCPRPAYIRDRNGALARRDKRQEAIADYLEKEQWGCEERTLLDEEQEENLNNRPVLFTPTEEMTQPAGKPFTKDELDLAIHTIKKGKATGPDKMQGDVMKIMSEENRSILLVILNKTWDRKLSPPQFCEADIVSHYKKRRPYVSGKLPTNQSLECDL